jgi:hypothetical protein
MLSRFLLLLSSMLISLASADTNTMSRFVFSLQGQAKILYQSEVINNDYIVALGIYKKTDNRWQPEKQLRQRGLLSRYTVELPRDYNEAETFDFYRAQVPIGATLLFSCSRRKCGDSNNWANDHFGVKQLYGNNEDQHYTVFSLKTGVDQSQLSYITIYTVRRGNRRIYAQLDVLHVK